MPESFDEMRRHAETLFDLAAESDGIIEDYKEHVKSLIEDRDKYLNLYEKLKESASIVLDDIRYQRPVQKDAWVQLCLLTGRYLDCYLSIREDL
jgi:hypothetical protein